MLERQQKQLLPKKIPTVRTYACVYDCAYSVNISFMNKEIETKCRDDPMEIQYDGSSKYRMRKRTFKASILTKTQIKRSPDYSASQDKEIMIKPPKIEYINIHKNTFNKGHLSLFYLKSSMASNLFGFHYCGKITTGVFIGAFMPALIINIQLHFS